jgi:hypothetical protein
MALYHTIVEALTPLIKAFNQLGIMYYIGGSVSSVMVPENWTIILHIIRCFTDFDDYYLLGL